MGPLNPRFRVAKDIENYNTDENTICYVNSAKAIKWDVHHFPFSGTIPCTPRGQIWSCFFPLLFFVLFLLKAFLVFFFLSNLLGVILAVEFWLSNEISSMESLVG